MKVAPDPLPDTPGTIVTAPQAQPASSSPAASAQSANLPGESHSANAPTTFDTNVTFRRDENGRIYYVVSSAKSGQEILELPPEQVRKLSQGIDEYLKHAANSAPHVDAEA